MGLGPTYFSIEQSIYVSINIQSELEKKRFTNAASCGTGQRPAEMRVTTPFAIISQPYTR